jgi:DNA primase
MFPISDFRGRIIAFGGRALDPDAPAKYLNSPETSLFHKGASLYNGAAARQAVHDGATLIAVEGYVDVIAMVTAGYPATVAPLGTALTEDQLGLLWRLADEPILCFDGDAAGRRAAYRAVDLALPRLRPGKSLRFALLPEGHDPDDLVRSGGREAVAEVLAGARPLADMLWTRETEASSFDTPERRAALEARVNELAAAIGDDAVRKYYRQDLEARLRALFQPQPVAGRRADERMPRRFGPAERRPVGGGRFPAGRPGYREQLAPLSPRLGSSPIVRGFRSALPPREALILMAVLNNPWLLDHHAEEFAELEFLNPDADALRRTILEAGAHHEAADPAALRATLAARGLEAVLVRVEAAITHASDWAAREGAAVEDVERFWTQIIVLHRKVRTLNKELKDAERALGENSSEANWARFRDVQGRLSALEGTEALIEGYGQFSGRSARSL